MEGDNMAGDDEVLIKPKAEPKSRLPTAVASAIDAGLRAARINPNDPNLADFKSDFRAFAMGYKKPGENVEWPIPNANKFLTAFKSNLQKAKLWDDFAAKVDLKSDGKVITLTQKSSLKEALPIQEPKQVFALRKALETAAKKFNISLPEEEIKKFLVIYKDNLEARAAKPVRHRDGWDIPLEFGKNEKKAKDFVATVKAELAKSSVKVEFLDVTAVNEFNSWFVRIGTPATTGTKVTF
jgi:hypothetical protein